MKQLTLILLNACILAVGVFPASAQDNQAAQMNMSDDNSYVYPSQAGIRAKLEEWRDLKFGILLHWGLYSVPGIVESWSICSEDQAWIPRDSSIAYENYKQWYRSLNKEFKAENFDPSQWALASKKAGMKYMVFTTKHHDGFCLFDSKYTDYTIRNTPFGDSRLKAGKDVDALREVFEAFRGNDFKIGAYFSKPDWHCENYWWSHFATPNRRVNYTIAKHPSRWEAYKKFTYNQLEEIASNYGPLDILWLDGGWVCPPREDIDMPTIASMVRSHQKDLLIVDRTVHGEFENYYTPEHAIPAERVTDPWETCTPLARDWGWTPNAPYRSADEVIAMLVEIVAKGGSLLLGVGPKPDGLLEERAVQILEEIGQWLGDYGEAIYNTRSTEVYRNDDVWFTKSKDGTLTYAICVPGKGKPMSAKIKIRDNLPAKGSAIKDVKTGKRIKWRRIGNEVELTLPERVQQDGESIALKYQSNRQSTK